MPIAINGSGTLTGISVGGLPDGIVDADMLASNAVTAGKLASGVGGQVLQVKHMIIAGEFSSSNSTYADTGLTLSITPASTSSKILQLYNVLGAQNTDSSGNEARIKGFRDSTEIFATNDFMRLKADGSTNRHYNGLFMMDLDDPSTTSSVTYKLQAARTGGSGTFYVQNYSNMTLIEVAS